MSQPIPWYKQFWPWFIIALPLSAVIAGISTVLIAVNNKVVLVADDYHKNGKAITADNSRLKAASELGMIAHLQELGEPKQLQLSLNSLDGQFKQAIELHFAHPTLGDKDVTQTLTSDAAGNYSLPSPTMEGDWFIRITPLTQAWRLQQRLTLPLNRIIEISAQK